MTFVMRTAALLAVYNNATNLLRLPQRAYVPANLIACGLLTTAARRAGYRWRTLGLSRSGISPGLRWGATGAGAVAAGLGAALAWPRAAPFLADARVTGLTPRALAFRVGVRIPLGTVLPEELAFRGVLLGAWAQERSVPAAVTGSSLLFGVWHIGPTLVALQENEVELGRGGRALAVSGGVALTAVAGAALGFLRLRTGGIVAPALVHLATNALGTLAAHHAQRRPAGELARASAGTGSLGEGRARRRPRRGV